MFSIEQSYPKTYAVKNKNLETRMLSRSGGIFSALSDFILEKDGVIYGCIQTDSFLAIHTRATTVEERNRMRGSKYIQSNMGNCFAQIKQDLENELYVLFSGTSCQVAGLKGYLKKEYENLLCVDIVCHGVPSPMVWQHYLRWQEKRHNAMIEKVDFRNKRKFGWSSHVETLYMKTKSGKEIEIDSNIYSNIFYQHASLRPCCYQCPYKAIMHPSDISIADYWGIDQAVPGFNDNKGVSLVLINNVHGEMVFNAIKKTLDYQKTRIEHSMQPPFEAPFPKPKNRELFWNDFYSKSFSKVARKYGGYNKIKSYIKKSSFVKHLLQCR